MKAIAPIEFTVTEDTIEWTDKDDRLTILSSLSGDVTTGELAMEADDELSGLTGDVENKEAEKPKFEKKIKDTNDTTGKTSDWQDSSD